MEKIINQLRADALLRIEEIADVSIDIGQLEDLGEELQDAIYVESIAPLERALHKIKTEINNLRNEIINIALKEIK